MSQRFDTGTGSQRGSRFVERDVTIVAYTAHKQVDFTVRTDFFFILTAFCINIRRITIEEVDVFCWNINVIKEIAVHKAVVAFRMLFRQANIFVHIESNNMLEAHLARFVHFNQCFISCQRSTASRQAQNERTICRWFERVNTVNDMASSPFADLFSGIQGDQSHSSPQK